MRIADRDERPRSDFVHQMFGPEGSELLSALADRFKLRFFRFSDRAERLGDVTELGFTGTRTDLGRALDEVRRELAAVPLAGLVVVSDGADNVETSLTESLLQLQAGAIPVHTVGLGREQFTKDIELSRVEAPRTVLAGSSVAVDLSIASSGFGGETVQLTVEDAGRILRTQDVRLPDQGEVTTVRVHFKAAEPGPRLFRFRIAPEPGEMVRENNVLEVLIIVDDARRRILYFEGEPRFEVKFIRRAVADDENLRVITLQRTAENKFYRIGGDSSDLEGGFPKTRAELFQYHGLILGSIEASFFTHDQLRMIAEFVDQRGGGLLTLGGRHSFAEGGYAETPVADVLPVVLPSGAPSDSGSFFAEVKVALTPFGRAHPVTQIAADAESSEARWRELPELSTLNPLEEVKPGASTLLTGRAADLAHQLVVLAYQRYGRGKAIAFPVQDSWLWQMHADIPLDDMTHETFWRQLARWLVSGVASHVSVTTSADRAAPNAPVTFTAVVSDSGYIQLNGAEVIATITAPDGEERTVPMEWTVARDGEYRASFVPEQDGLYEIRVQAQQAGVSLGSGVSYVQVGDLETEYFDAEMRASLLERIADETGGRFYTPENVNSLAEDVSFTESGATIHEERDLWDMPVLFFLLVGLVAAEWGYRRQRGLA